MSALEAAIQTTNKLLQASPEDPDVQSVKKQLEAMAKFQGNREKLISRLSMQRMFMYSYSPPPNEIIGKWIDQCFAAIAEFRNGA
jgi:hypothetical protein